MGTIIKSEKDMPVGGTFVKFKTSPKSEWIMGMITTYLPVCFVEGFDPHSTVAPKYMWNEVYEFQVAKRPKGFED